MNDYEKSTPVDTTNTNYDEGVTGDSKSSKNNRGKNKLVVIVIIILLLLGALGVFIYYRVVNSKNIFKTLINDTYTYLESNMNTSDTVSGTFNLKVDGTSSDSSTNDMLGILGNIELTGNYGIDYKNKIISHKLFWNINRKAGSVGKNTIHPAIFPTELINRICIISTNKGDLVVDPFLGSGTSLIASINNCRNFIGYE